MGSFNVSCSVSNMSIDCGDEVAFIFLIPSEMNKKNHDLIPTRALDSVHAYFKPFALPVFGAYNDYGALEDIKRDKNVEILEKYFQMPIEDIIESISEQREVHSYVGTLFKHYVVNQEIISSYKVGFDFDFLEALGFRDEGGMIYVHPESNIKVQVTYTVSITNNKKNQSSKFKYALIDENNNVLKKSSYDSSYYQKTEFIDDFYAVSGIQLNTKPTVKDQLSWFSRLSGMFVMKEVYDSLANWSIENQKDPSPYPLFHMTVDDSKPEQEDVERFFGFITAMKECNRFFLPGFNGEQTGNPRVSKRLVDASLELI